MKYGTTNLKEFRQSCLMFAGMAAMYRGGRSSSMQSEHLLPGVKAGLFWGEK